MAFKIGFITDRHTDSSNSISTASSKQQHTAKESVVQIYFPQRNMSLAYYNDRFDLKVGNMVYVDGKLEGKIGRVTSVNYNFKIDLSYYKRVIAVLDTDVNGHLFISDTFFLSFDSDVLSRSQVRLWFMPPVNNEDEYATGYDDTSFALDDLRSMNISSDIAQRGHEYYMENKVKYINLNGTSGYAIVQSSEPYEVEFEYKSGNISNLVCSCFCSYNCKHEFATMLELRDMLEFIENHYADEFHRTGCFSAIGKSDFFLYAVDNKSSGSLTLN